ncbi:AraC family transcriptional regulator [Alistipes sp.]|uniref:AraC family transcriptional regulator n=1 Tax=Alistipes sp. TaxID=1872444 RepID=UPI0025BC9998|nr:AraC family transcriptional regulator [Alistipes sp.]
MIAIGFKGERVAVLPRPFVSLMEDNPLTGDLYVTSIGYASNAAHPYKASSNGEEEYFFIYCTIGRGCVESGGYGFEIHANQYVVVSASRSYVIRADAASPWTIYWMTFRGAKAKIYASMMSSVTTILPSTHSRIEQRTEIFESIFSLVNGELSIDRLNYANLLLATYFASFVYVDAFNESIPQNVSRARTMVNQVTHYMSENIEKRLTLKQLADYAGYSPSYFYRNFVKEMDESPVEYFIKMKINKASIYLIKSPMTIAQIAAKLGFNNPDYFSRTFRKIVGLSASEFRKQHFRL